MIIPAIVSTIVGGITWVPTGKFKSPLRLKIDELNSKVTTIEKMLSPTVEEAHDNGLHFDVRSIPKLLATINMEGGTLLDYVTNKSKNGSDVSLNMIKIHDNIVNSLKKLKI